MTLAIVRPKAFITKLFLSVCIFLATIDFRVWLEEGEKTRLLKNVALI